MSEGQPRRLSEGSDEFAEVLALIRTAFAYMEDRIDPPSSMHRLTVDSIAAQAASGEVWVIGAPIVACVFLTPQPDHLYLGKLAVADQMRGNGLARRLFEVAESRARALGLHGIRLQSRVELVENHAVFAAMGYRKVGEEAHEGYDRPTSYSFWKDVVA